MERVTFWYGCNVLRHGDIIHACLDILRAMGIDSVQGYVYAGPMSEGDYAAWLARDRGEQRSVA